MYFSPADLYFIGHKANKLLSKLGKTISANVANCFTERVINIKYKLLEPLQLQPDSLIVSQAIAKYATIQFPRHIMEAPKTNFLRDSRKRPIRVTNSIYYKTFT
jgi:hypothetical protein